MSNNDSTFDLKYLTQDWFGNLKAKVCLDKLDKIQHVWQ